ncbi:hypothetical protein AB837_00311 [bacterium AB1]|nr:hypothetical protein AB837_00311 [bacterium AB1]
MVNTEDIIQKLISQQEFCDSFTNQSLFNNILLKDTKTLITLLNDYIKEHGQEEGLNLALGIIAKGSEDNTMLCQAYNDLNTFHNKLSAKHEQLSKANKINLEKSKELENENTYLSKELERKNNYASLMFFVTMILLICNISIFVLFSYSKILKISKNKELFISNDEEFGVNNTNNNNTEECVDTDA